MMGREAGTLGNVKGTDYIAAEAKKMGLQPAGENGTYFQTFPMIVQAIADGASFTANGQSLALNSDFAPLIAIGQRAPRALKDTALQVIFAGRAGEAYKLTSEQTSGKLVVFLPPTKEAVAANPAIERSYPPRADNGAALAYVAYDRLSPGRKASLPYSQPIPDQGGQQLPTPMAQPVFYLSNAAAEKIFGKPLDQLEAGATANAVSISYDFVTKPAPFPARNVVAILPGSDPVLKNTYVAVGAHNDHEGVAPTAFDHDSIKALHQIARLQGAEQRSVNPTAEQWVEINALIAEMRKANPPRRDSIFNGADDDGSGTVAVLEIAENLSSLKVKPKRSMLFVWHTGEEKGLWGSMYYTDNPTVPRDSIVAQLNIDMVGRGEASDIVTGNADFLQLIGSRRLSTELGDIVEQVNTEKKHGMKFDYSLDANGHPANIYCRSDHYSYARYGIPVTFFTTGVHPDYHQLTDEPQYINYKHLERVTSLISDIALEVANRATRPTVDKPKPDPRGRCQQ